MAIVRYRIIELNVEMDARGPHSSDLSVFGRSDGGKLYLQIQQM